MREPLPDRRRGVALGQRIDSLDTPAWPPFLTQISLSRYNSALMPKRPPDTVDPVEFAEKGRVLEGVLPLAGFERLRDLLIDAAGEVRFVLRFAKEGSVIGVRGHLETDLALQCQRCLGALRYRIDSEIAIGFVGSVEQAHLLPESFEPVIVGTGQAVRVDELVEDEILLSVPNVPRHELCEPVWRARAEGSMDTEARRRPFADLASLFQINTKRD